MPGRAFRSQLLPHLEMIREARRRRRTWREITAELKETAGIATSPSAVYEFFKRQTKGRRGPLGFPEPEGPPPGPAAAASPSPAPERSGVSAPRETLKPCPAVPPEVADLMERETPPIWG